MPYSWLFDKELAVRSVFATDKALDVVAWDLRASPKNVEMCRVLNQFTLQIRRHFHWRTDNNYQYPKPVQMGVVPPPVPWVNATVRVKGAPKYYQSSMTYHITGRHRFKASYILRVDGLILDDTLVSCRRWVDTRWGLKADVMGNGGGIKRDVIAKFHIDPKLSVRLVTGEELALAVMDSAREEYVDVDEPDPAWSALFDKRLNAFRDALVEAYTPPINWQIGNAYPAEIAGNDGDESTISLTIETPSEGTGYFALLFKDLEHPNGLQQLTEPFAVAKTNDQVRVVTELATLPLGGDDTERGAAGRFVMI